MKTFLGMFAAFTIGALCVEVKSLRAEMASESAHNARETELQRKVECSYHEGYNEGWNDQETLAKPVPKFDIRNARLKP